MCFLNCMQNDECIKFAMMSVFFIRPSTFGLVKIVHINVGFSWKFGIVHT